MHVENDCRNAALTPNLDLKLDLFVPTPLKSDLKTAKKFIRHSAESPLECHVLFEWLLLARFHPSM